MLFYSIYHEKIKKKHKYLIIFIQFKKKQNKFKQAVELYIYYKKN